VHTAQEASWQRSFFRAGVLRGSRSRRHPGFSVPWSATYLRDEARATRCWPLQGATITRTQDPAYDAAVCAPLAGKLERWS